MAQHVHKSRNECLAAPSIRRSHMPGRLWHGSETFKCPYGSGKPSVYKHVKDSIAFRQLWAWMNKQYKDLQQYNHMHKNVTMYLITESYNLSVLYTYEATPRLSVSSTGTHLGVAILVVRLAVSCNHSSIGSSLHTYASTCVSLDDTAVIN